MEGRFFLDTNLLIYAMDPSAGEKRKKSLDLIAEGIGTGRGVVSYQVVQEWFNVALRKAARPLAADEAFRFYQVFLMPMWRVQSGSGLVDAALSLHARHSLSWYDALIVASAIQSGCSVLYSEDLHHGSRLEGVRVVNPFR